MTVAPHPFAVEVTSGPAGSVVRVAGELDVATVPDLDATLVALDGDIVVDLAALTFIDSSGLSGLVTAQKRAVRHGHSFVLRAPTGQVAKVLNVSGIDQMFVVEP